MSRLGWAGPVGAACFLVGVGIATARSHPPAASYLSELGAPGRPGSDAYRLGLVGGGLGGLGVALAVPPSPKRWALLATGILVALQAAAPCTAGCPLPVIDAGAGWRNTLHFTVALVGFSCWTAVTGLDAAEVATGIIPVASRLLGATMAVHLGLLGGLLWIDPHGALSGILQRTLVLTALAWLTLAGATLARRRTPVAA